MQKSLELSKLGETVCGECGKAFQKPVLATISSSEQMQTYYACPRCMMRVSEGEREASISKNVAEKTLANSENSEKCGHFLGYLKKRAKDAPIPDECFTCHRMVKCLLS